jgi:hypothetical protein
MDKIILVVVVLTMMLDDVWIISRDYTFEQAYTFMAKSVYYGLSSTLGTVEVNTFDFI